MADESTFSQNPEAVEFVKLVSTKTYRKAELGDATTFTPNPYNYPKIAQDAIEEGLSKVHALSQDKTRTLVQKHDAARTVTDTICEQIETARVGLERNAAALNNAGEAAIIEKLDVDRVKPQMFGLICDWIRRNALAPNGHATIREKVDNDIEVAAVVFYSKGFTLDLAPDFHSRMTELAYTKHVPEAKSKFDRAAELRKWAGNYPQVQRSLRASLYSKALADQVSTRVEL